MSPSYYYIKLYLVPTPLIGDQIVAFSLAGPMPVRLVIVHNKFYNKDERSVNMIWVMASLPLEFSGTRKLDRQRNLGGRIGEILQRRAPGSSCLQSHCHQGS